ncbi:MAG: hypothetical protein ABI240_17035 [Sphingomonas sp.]
MSKAVFLAVILAIPLAACGVTKSEVIAYTVDVDADKGVAVFSCKQSSNEKCIFKFDDPGAKPQSLTVAKGEAGNVTSVGVGSSYCVTTGAAGATCKAQTLQAGTQTIHREKRSTS